ncbi:hypothetical protein ABZU45_09710 [Streptomyces avermitilis]|uniref:hypothetical protein n=1 Tax=Streptomyces avermitilis TaxID=33903 RepID=UPI0033A8560D
MSTSALPRARGGSGYRWAEHPRTHVHRTLPRGTGARTGICKTSWQTPSPARRRSRR